MVQGAQDPPTVVRMSLDNYLQYMASNKDTDPLYLFEYQLPPDLLRTLAVPEYFQMDYLSELAEEEDKADGQVFWNKSGCGEDAAGLSQGQRWYGERADQGAANLLQERRWLVAGPAGSGSRFHCDPYCTSAWNALLSGRKLWVFYPPGRALITLMTRPSTSWGPWLSL